MSKITIFVITFVNIAIAIMVASVMAINSVYSQNTITTITTTTQQTKNSNTSSVASPIKELNTSVIVDAINAKLKSIYDDTDEKAINSVTKIDQNHSK